MAMQPNDRSKAKGIMSTSKRQKPQLINRRNKRTIGELLSSHEPRHARFHVYWGY